MAEAGVHLGVLGLRPGADSGEIKRAFRALAKRHHPDKNPNDVAASSERFRRVNDAYQFLIDAQDRGGRRPPNSPPAADAAFATRARREAEARAAKRDTAQRAAAEERRREAQRAAAKVRAAKLEEMREAQQRQRDERDRCDEAERRHEAEAQRQRDAFERDRRDEIARLAREARVREAGRKVAADRRLAEDRASRLAAEAHRAAALAAAREEEQKRQWDAALRQSAQAAEAQLRFSSEAARVQRERWRVDGESDEGDASMVDDDAEWWRLNREGAAPFNLQNTAAADRGGEAFDADECWGAFETASEALRKARDIRAAKVDKNQQQDGWTTRAESEAFYASCVGAAEAVLGPAGYNPGRYEVQRGPANVTNEAAYAAAQAEVAGAGRAATKADSAAEELESLLRAFGHLAPEFVYQHHREQQAQQQQQEEQQQEQQQRWRPPIPAPVQNGASFDRRRPRDPDLTPTLDEVFNDAAKQRHARFQAAMHRREQAERGAILARGAAKRLRVVEAASGSVELEWDDEAGVAALKWQLQWCARGGAWEDAPRLLEATRCRKRNLASDTDYRFRVRSVDVDAVDAANRASPWAAIDQRTAVDERTTVDETPAAAAPAAQRRRPAPDAAAPSALEAVLRGDSDGDGAAVADDASSACEAADVNSAFELAARWAGLSRGGPVAAPRPRWYELQDESGTLFFWDELTGETRWERDRSWRPFFDADTGAEYYASPEAPAGAAPGGAPSYRVQTFVHDGFVRPQSSPTNAPPCGDAAGRRNEPAVRASPETSRLPAPHPGDAHPDDAPPATHHRAYFDPGDRLARDGRLAAAPANSEAGFHRRARPSLDSFLPSARRSLGLLR